MDDFEQFAEELKDALGSLYDPGYESSDLMKRVLGDSRRDGVDYVRSRLLESIDALRSREGLPEDSNVARDVDVLYHRFCRRLTQIATAHRLNLSLRTVQRGQRRATHLLAEHLWRAALEAGRVEVEEPAAGTAGQPTDWLAQTGAELASLQRSAPDAYSDIAAVIEGMLRIAQVAVADEGVRLARGSVPEGLQAAIHPSVLRQVLLAALLELNRRAPAGRITLSAGMGGDHVWVMIEGEGVPVNAALDLAVVEELLAANGGRLDRGRALGGKAQLTVTLPAITPASSRVTVLVIDDNRDWLSLYESYCIGTPYELVHVALGREAFEAIDAERPDIVLLDVMLPDVDGWDLLLDLHNGPLTRDIPVIVCSVIKGEELALTLGASLYLRKPVYRQDLLDAFERILSLAGAGP